MYQFMFEHLASGPLRDVSQKKTGKWGNFGKTGGGGLPESHFHFFTVFNMGDLPKLNGKIGKNSQTYAYFEKWWSVHHETFGAISITEIVSGAHF